MWKETYIREKRRVYREDNDSAAESLTGKSRYVKEICICMKRELYIYLWKERFRYKMNISVYMRKDDESAAEYTLYGEDRYVTRGLYIWKESYTCEKRPTYIEREVYIGKMTSQLPILHSQGKISNVKRDLYIWEGTYIYGSRPTDSL